MFCNQCGKIVPDGTKFCEYCGCAMPAAAPVQNVFAQQQNNVPVNPTGFSGQPNQFNHSNQPNQPIQSIPNVSANPQNVNYPTSNGMPVQNNYGAFPQQPQNPAQNSPFGSVQPSFTQQQPPVSSFSQPFSQPAGQPQPMNFNNMNPDMGAVPNFSGAVGVPVQEAAKGSNKLLKILLIVIPIVLVLAVAGFFIVRLIMNNAETQYMREHPTAYVFSSYGSSLNNVMKNDEVFSVLGSDSKQQTAKINVTMNQPSAGIDNMSAGMTCAYDSENGKMYLGYDMNNAFKAALSFNSAQTGLRLQAGSKSYDYVINNDATLRDKAKKSIFGPQGKNLGNIDEQTFDTILDAYELMVGTITATESNDKYNLKDFGEKIGKTIDTCGNVQLSEGSVSVDGQNVNADIITHTFTDMSVVSAVCKDLREWKDSAGLSSEVNAALNEALTQAENSLSSMNNTKFNLVIKHYISKDNRALVYVDVSLTLPDDNGVFNCNISFGADPSTSNKITFNAQVSNISGNSLTEKYIPDSSNSSNTFTAVLSRSSDASTNVYELNMQSGGQTVNFTLTRQKSTGDFTLTGKHSDGRVLIDNVTGNIQTGNGSINIKFNNIASSGMNVEFYLSDKYEGTDITSNNELFSITEEDIARIGTEISSEMSSLGGLGGLGGYGGSNYTYDYDDYDSDYSYEDYYDNYYNDTSSVTQGLTLSYKKAA